MFLADIENTYGIAESVQTNARNLQTYRVQILQHKLCKHQPYKHQKLQQSWSGYIAYVHGRTHIPNSKSHQQQTYQIESKTL